MKPSEYQKLAERTSATATKTQGFDIIKRLNPQIIRLLHAGSGLDTESGEFMDVLKRTIFYGKELDRTTLKEEIGDILWYCMEALNALDVNFERVMEQNIAKLRERYPAKFTEQAALNRDLDAERAVLESKEKSPIDCVGIHRRGGADQDNGKVVVEIGRTDGTREEVGVEDLNSNFSSWWRVDPGKGARRSDEIDYSRPAYDI